MINSTAWAHRAHPAPGGPAIRKLKDRLRAELAARDAAASDRRRERAHRAVTVTRRSVGDGVSELVAGMPDELAAACQATIDALAAGAVSPRARRVRHVTGGTAPLSPQVAAVSAG